LESHVSSNYREVVSIINGPKEEFREFIKINCALQILNFYSCLCTTAFALKYKKVIVNKEIMYNEALIISSVYADGQIFLLSLSLK